MKRNLQLRKFATKLMLGAAMVPMLAISLQAQDVKPIPEGTPEAIEKPKLYLKYDNNNIPGVDKLVFNGLTGKVTQKELKGLTEYFLDRPIFTTNWHNTLFASWTKAHMMEWLYDVNGDIRLVNRMIEQANSINDHRDDHYRKYKTKISDTEAIYTKGWSHFRGMEELNGEQVKSKLGIATLGTGTNFPALTASMIANHPEIWKKKYQGKTYKEIMKVMLERVHESWGFAIKHYYDKKTNLLLSPSFGAEPLDYVPQWNRIFPLMAAGNVLVDTYEKLGEKDARAEKVDRIMKALIKEFWENSRTETVNGSKVLLFPYGVYRLKSNPMHTEDGGHYGFDLRGFRAFHESGRYWNKEQTQLLANVMAENIVKDDKGTFAKRLDGSGESKKYDYWGALPPMIWLAEFRPDLDHKMVEYIYSVMNKRGCLDGRVVFHSLHLRAKRYGIEK
ncbi:hypothetical protein EYV94_07655 [Puteibacter caeruleilacunae]|nr:hypothetical protein EYV94_07655 [Puteibacter caeruleilacunae]